MYDATASTGEALVRPTLTARIVDTSALAERDVEAMYSLLGRHFLGVDPHTFRRDLSEKNWVVLLEDNSGRLRGFSTFLIYATTACGWPMTVVYSGDTIVEPAAWGSPVLPRAWIRAIYDIARDYPAGDLYWLLLTSGFRTYRFVSVFCRRFFPRCDARTPPEFQRILDALSVERFGSAYDADSGLVRFSRPQVLRARLRGVPDGRSADPHVQFFLERNPGHVQGDELVSLASLAPENLTAAGRRMLR